MLGLSEVLIIGGAIVLIFGASQIPKIAKSLGEGLKEFKKSVKEAKDIDMNEEKEKEKKEVNSKSE
jgi:sec-independent protein translocase protein TatA